jgi:hypothetical protein
MIMHNDKVYQEGRKYLDPEVVSRNHGIYFISFSHTSMFTTKGECKDSQRKPA